jgi:phage/plasmid-associated DNA primase
MENWYTYSNDTHLWGSIKEPQKIIKEYLFLCVSENNKHIAKKIAGVHMAADSKRLELIALQKQFLGMYSKIESLQTLTLVKRDLMISLADDEFVNKLDDKAGKLVFKNGIYDIACDTFREGLKYEDNLSFTLPYNYRKAKAADIEKTKKEIMKICANQPWRYEYYMECLGFSMMGTPEKEQAAFFMIGCGGNGKSLLLEALEKMMPKYVVKLSSKTFSKGNQDFKKNINSMKGARIAWINEVEKIKQDIDLIKAIADGTAIRNPVLYKQMEEYIKILAKLFFVSNMELSFTSDGGIKRRYRYVEFVAKFHTKQVWEKLTEKRKDIDFEADNGMLAYFTSEDGFFALLELILEGARRWIKNGVLNVPEQYQKLADEACEKNEEFAEFVDAHIVKSVGQFVSRFEIEECYKMEYNTRLPNEKTEFREYMASKGFGYDCKKKKRVNALVCNGCYLDCELTNTTTDDLEEE